MADTRAKAKRYNDIMGSVGNLNPVAQQQYQRNQARTRGRTPARGNANGNVGWWNEDHRAAKTKAPVTRGRKRRTSESESSSSSTITEVSATKPLINLEQPSPAFWSYGLIIIMLLVFIVEMVQSDMKFSPLSENPMYGPDEGVLLQIGAKYGPYILEGQFWRLGSAMFVSSGIVHFAIDIFLIIFTLRVERTSGFWRAVFIFLLSGLFGYILSCIFVPNLVSCGATGACLGYFGVLLSDLFATWRSAEKRFCRLIGYLVVIVVMLACGLTPYFDNFMHVGGLVMGFLCALMFLPNLNFGACERFLHGIVAFLAFPVTATIFMVCLVIFFRRVDSNVDWCPGCYKINCVNISNWCTDAVSGSDTIMRI